VRILDEAGNDVTSEYDEISFDGGTLMIEKRPMTIQYLPVVREYDRYAGAGKNAVREVTNVLVGHTVSNSTRQKGVTYPGAYEEAILPINVAIKNAKGDDVTNNYEITALYSTVTIVPRKITITVSDVTVSYDGNMHQAEGYSADRLLEGDFIGSIELIGEASKVGVYEGLLKAKDAVVLSASGRDMSNYYEISYLPGTLRIESGLDDMYSLSTSVVNLEEGMQIQLFVDSKVANAVLPEVEWFSSDERVVTVDQNGVLTKCAAGEAIVGVKDKSGWQIECRVLDEELSSMKLPAALRVIEQEAWMGDEGLQKVNLLAAKQPVIGARAFKDCSELQVVLLPDGASFADDSFDGCERVVLYCSDEAAIQAAKTAGLEYVALISFRGK